MSSTLNLTLKPTQIGVRCSGTRKWSKRFNIDHFCQGFCSAIQSSEMPPEIPSELHLEIPFEISPEMHLEMHFEIPPELHLEMHFEISTNNEIYGRSIRGMCNTSLRTQRHAKTRKKQQDENAIPSSTQKPTPNLLLKL